MCRWLLSRFSIKPWAILSPTVPPTGHNGPFAQRWPELLLQTGKSELGTDSAPQKRVTLGKSFSFSKPHSAHVLSGQMYLSLGRSEYDNL